MKKLSKTSKLAVLLLASIAYVGLTGCALNNKPLPPIQTAYPKIGNPPAYLLKRCPRLLALSQRQFSEAEVIAAWSADSRQYKECAKSKDALVAWYMKRDTRLTGNKSKSTVKKRLVPRRNNI